MFNRFLQLNAYIQRIWSKSSSFLLILRFSSTCNMAGVWLYSLRLGGGMKLTPRSYARWAQKFKMSHGSPTIERWQKQQPPTYNYVFCKAKWPNLRLFSAASSSSWKNQQSINLLQLFCFSCCDSVICSKALLVREGPHNNSLMPFPIRLFPPLCWQMRRRTSLSFQVQHFCFFAQWHKSLRNWSHRRKSVSSK